MTTPDQYRREGAEAMLQIVETEVRRVLQGMVTRGVSPEKFPDAPHVAIRAIDVDEVLAGLEPVTGGQYVVEVCPICDIAGCRHIRMNRPAPEFDAAIFSDVEALYETDGQPPAPDPTARLVEAARAMRSAICGPDGFAECVRRDSGRAYPWPALEIAESLMDAALASMGADHDLR